MLEGVPMAGASVLLCEWGWGGLRLLKGQGLSLSGLALDFLWKHDLREQSSAALSWAPGGSLFS